VSNSSDELQMEMNVKTEPPTVVFCVKPDPTGGFTARAVDDAIFIEGDTEETLESNARDAIRCHFDDSIRPIRIELRAEKAHTRQA